MYIKHSYYRLSGRFVCIFEDRQIFKFGFVKNLKEKGKFKNSARV